MSPTFLPVLMLSLFLIPLPTAEAGEMMDLLALIRRTLKYWHRIYTVYEEEVTLGYCLADYFLHLGVGVKSAPMSALVSAVPLNFVPVDIHAFGRRTKRDRSSDNISMDIDPRFAARKLSYEMANVTREKTSSETLEGVVKKYNGWEESVERSMDFDGDSRGVEGIQLYSNAESVKDYLNYSDGNHNRVKRSNVMRNSTGIGEIWGTLTNVMDEGNRQRSESVEKVIENNDLYSRTGYKRDNKGGLEWVDNNRVHGRTKYSYNAPSSAKIEISKNFEGLARTTPDFKISKPDERSSSVWKNFFAKSTDQSRVGRQKRSETVKVDVPLKKLKILVYYNWRPIKSLYKTRPQFSTINKTTKSPPTNLLKDLLHAETQRKSFYEHTVQLKLAEPQTPPASSDRKIASLNPRLKDIEPRERLEDNRESGDFLRQRRYGLSILEFQRAEQRSFRENYRRNLRRKRGANDRIRSRSVLPLSKNGGASSNTPTSRDEISRFSSRYRMSGNRDISTTKIESSSIDPRDDDPFLKTEIPIYHFEHYRGNDKTSSNYKRTAATSSVAPDKIKNISSDLMNVDGQIFPSTSNYPSLKNLSEADGQKQTKNRGEGNSSKQLLIPDDNRQRRTVNTFLVKMSVPGRTRKNQAILYPVGRPSLLPVSYLRFIGDYGNSTSVTARNSRASQSSGVKDQGRRSLTEKVETRGLKRSSVMFFHVRQLFTSFLRALGFAMNVGRQLMDYVDSNSALACTKDYLVGKAIHWIDS